MGKKGIWFSAFFAAFGLLFAAIGGWFWHSDAQLAGMGERAPGVVTGFASSYSSDGGTTYKPVVRFTTQAGEEREFTSSVGSSPAAYDRGEEVEVIYDPWTPEKAMIDSFTERHLFPLVFGGLGALFAVIGFAMMGWQIKRQRTISWLKMQGTAIDAEFLDCYHDTSFKVNGRSPWRVTAQAVHPATGKLAVFKSEAIWANPAAFLQGKPVRVLIDPKNPKRHYVDLEQILGESALG